MPTRRFENMAPERKKKILDAAKQEFMRSGFERASLNDIVRAAGISKGSLYYYFEDKTDLYITVLDLFIQELVEEFGGILSGEFTDDFWGDFEKHCIHMIQYTLVNQGILRFSRELFYLPHSASKSEPVAALYKKGRKIMTRILARGQEVGAVRTDIPMELLVTLVMRVDDAMDMWLVENWEKVSPDELNQIGMLYLDMYKRLAGTESYKGGGNT